MIPQEVADIRDLLIKKFNIREDIALNAAWAIYDRGNSMREALELFFNHYPHGINPYLDDAHRKARAALAQ